MVMKITVSFCYRMRRTNMDFLKCAWKYDWCHHRRRRRFWRAPMTKTVKQFNIIDLTRSTPTINGCVQCRYIELRYYLCCVVSATTPITHALRILFNFDTCSYHTNGVWLLHFQFGSSVRMYTILHSLSAHPQRERDAASEDVGYLCVVRAKCSIIFLYCNVCFSRAKVLPFRSQWEHLCNTLGTF